MSDLDMDELSPSARALIDEVRDLDGPVPADRARVKRALVATIASGAGLAAGTAASSTAAAGTATATTAAAGSLSLGVKIAAIAMVAAAVGGTTLVITQPDEAPARPVARQSVPAIEPREDHELAPRAEAVAAEPVVEVAAPVVDAVAAEPPAEAVEPLEGLAADPVAEEPTEPASTPIPQPAPRARRAPEEAAPTAPADSTLSEELVLLRDAQRAMSEQRAARALELLDDHARRFPSGILEEEREAARVVALCQSDRRDEAQALAARFLRERPSSPHRARVRSACP